jgi:hypothetical protein
MFWIQSFGNTSSGSQSSYGVLNIHEDSVDYDMKHLKRGKCLILNHENFLDQNICPPRKGSTADALALHGCFRDLGFDAQIYPDFTSKQIIELFSKSMS